MFVAETWNDNQLLLQWFKYHRPFASHRLFYFYTLFLSEFADQILMQSPFSIWFKVLNILQVVYHFFSKTMKKTLFASFCNLCMMLHLHALPVFVSRTFLLQTWQGTLALMTVHSATELLVRIIFRDELQLGRFRSWHHVSSNLLSETTNFSLFSSDHSKRLIFRYPLSIIYLFLSSHRSRLAPWCLHLPS